MSGNYQGLGYLIDRAGWLNDGWGFEIGFSNQETNFYIENHVRGIGPGLDKDLTNFFIGRGSYILQSGMLSPNTVIGRHCSLSKNVYLGNHNHRIDCLCTQTAPKEQGEASKLNTELTVVGSDVWIGVSVVVLQGVKIGHGAVVGAGSVVTKDVPPYAVVVGNPARIIKYRFSEETIAGLLETKWWMLPKAQIDALPQEDVDLCIETIRQIRQGSA